MGDDNRILQMILDRVNSIDTKLDRMNGRVDGIDNRLTTIETIQVQNEKARGQSLTVRLVFLTAGLGAFWWAMAEVIKRFVLK